MGYDEEKLVGLRVLLTPQESNTGHVILWDTDSKEWFWYDTGEACEGSSRPCKHCGKQVTWGDAEPDPCFGSIPGVQYACCGHGKVEFAYVWFDDGTELREQEALDYFEAVKKRKGIVW